MSLFTKLCEAVHSWRRRRVGVKPSRKRSSPMMEQLDHRQLLAVNFTGVAATDFPTTTGTGVQVVTGVPFFDQAGTATNLPNANNAIPIIPPVLLNSGLVTRSGYEIDQLRVTYTPADDTLSVGVEGPSNGRDANEVIAGDADNNGNSGTVDPRINDLNGGGVDPGLFDPADMSGTETYGVSLAFNDATIPDVVAGFAQGAATDTSAKPFEVARVLPQTSGSVLPQFDQTQTLPQYTGNYYLANDPTRPNFEFQIPHFSQLYQQITGKALTSTAQIGIGAFATSIQSGGISDEVFSPLPLNLTQATPPTPVTPVTPVCPPMEPTIYVNYHQDNHINTAHNGPIRVNILGSSSFDPTTIVPSSVRFGDSATLATTGATPVLNFEHNVNHDAFPDETFVFNGLDVDLPAGKTVATISGTTTSGQAFESAVSVFNRDASYYTPSQIKAQQNRFARYDQLNNIDTSDGIVAPPTRVPALAEHRATSAAIDDLVNPFAGRRVPAQVNPGATNDYITSTGVISSGVSAASAKTVSIPRKNAAGKTAKTTSVRIVSAKAGKATHMQSNLTISNASGGSGMPTTLNLAGAG